MPLLKLLSQRSATVGCSGSKLLHLSNLPNKTSGCRTLIAKKNINTKATPEVLKLWKNAKAVCFDVDSTVIQDEGIDVLADFKGVGDEVKKWTANAMGGSVTFQDALAARLAIIKPSKADVINCLIKHPPALTKGIPELFKTLQNNGVHVYLVSGGFRLMIEPVADMLHIPRSRIYANTIVFNNDGTYKAFDPKEPTSRSGGKTEVVQTLINKNNYSPIVMIGDGVTDMQAKPPADLFIGFGGIAIREAVQKGADWFVTDFQELIKPIR